MRERGSLRGAFGGKPIEDGSPAPKRSLICPLALYNVVGPARKRACLTVGFLEERIVAILREPETGVGMGALCRVHRVRSPTCHK